MSDRFDDLLKNFKTLLPKLQDAHGRSNCPLTAQAVWNYFNTGKVVAARPVMTGATHSAQCGPIEPIQRDEIRPRFLKTGHGTHGILTTHPGTKKEHSFNVVNIRGIVYLVDAYNANQPKITKDIAGAISADIPLELVMKSALYMVPEDAIKRYRCPQVE